MNIQTGSYWSGSYFFDIVSQVSLPFFYDIGKIILLFCVVQGVYLFMRSDPKACLNKVKFAIIGYLILRLVSVGLVMIDAIATSIETGIGI
jgi:hypothetical protein